MTFREQLAALGFSSYLAYLRSDHWRKTRARFYRARRLKGRCQACLRKTRLHVHHKSYAHLGHEWNSDLVALCGPCHRGVHALKRDRSTPLSTTTFAFIRAKRREIRRKG